MSRNYDQFPDDENGDVLWRMAQDDDNLEKKREIDFSVIFPSEEAALKFAVHLLRNEQKVTFSAYERNDEMPWQVHAHAIMQPTHESISTYEQLLAKDAKAFGGRNDGWGCFAQK